jgi:hypothetical protein
MDDEKKLIGAWSLISCRHLLQEGGEILPFGERPNGILIYTADKLMSVMLGAGDRKNFPTAGLFEGTTEDKARAAETFVAYSGNYEITPTEVIHHVKMSLFPNWAGTSQRRYWRLENESLILSTGVFTSNGKEQTAQLIWAPTNRKNSK